MAYGIVTALRQAISSARTDAGVTGWFDIREYTEIEHQMSHDREKKIYDVKQHCSIPPLIPVL